MLAPESLRLLPEIASRLTLLALVPFHTMLLSHPVLSDEG